MEEKERFVALDNDSPLPTIHIISDSIGATAQTVARAAAGQFGFPEPYVETLPKVRGFDEIKTFLTKHQQTHIQKGKSPHLVVFFTLVDPDLRRQVGEFCEENGMYAVDLMSGPIETLQKASGLAPSTDSGLLRQTDEHYFRRIEAMEFTMEHDDGRNPQDLTRADIVLVGVSRSSKTPISMYLGMEGYRVANVPLALGTEPPKELYDCDPSRIFGLMISPDVLVGIRQRRLGGSGKGASYVASSYADPEKVYEDLEQARNLMRRLGCIVIHTERKAVEESAQEILRYYEVTHATHKNVIE
jgi:regulator of PEP synthase PpsR (kinase-PPPase family)